MLHILCPCWRLHSPPESAALPGPHEFLALLCLMSCLFLEFDPCKKLRLCFLFPWDSYTQVYWTFCYLKIYYSFSYLYKHIIFNYHIFIACSDGYKDTFIQVYHVLWAWLFSSNSPHPFHYSVLFTQDHFYFNAITYICVITNIFMWLYVYV